MRWNCAVGRTLPPGAAGGRAARISLWRNQPSLVRCRTVSLAGHCTYFMLTAQVGWDQIGTPAARAPASAGNRIWLQMLGAHRFYQNEELPP